MGAPQQRLSPRSPVSQRSTHPRTLPKRRGDISGGERRMPARCPSAVPAVPGLGEVQRGRAPLAARICYCSRGSASLCADAAAVPVRCGQGAARLGAAGGGSARRQHGLAIRRSAAELWDLCGEGRRQDGTDGGSELGGSARTGPRRGEGAQPRCWGALAHAWVRGALRSVQPLAARARISVQGADGGGKLWLRCAGDMWPHVMHRDQIRGLHTLRALCAASPGREDACSTLGLAEGPSCALRAHGCRICTLQRCAPAVCRLCFVPCGAVCATRGCVPALIQSRDAIGSTSAPEIWDSAGRISAVQPVWPWESVPTASVVTNSSYSGCAYRRQLPELPGWDPMGHIP